jgi:hypothetical protein
MAIALINGKNFSHQQMIFNVGGVPLLSLSDITMTKTAQREFSFGTSKLPVGYGDGRDEPGDLTFTLSLSDGRSLVAASPDNDPTNLAPFPIPLTLLNEAKPTLFVIKNVMIQSFEVTSDVDNKDIKMAFTAQFTHLDTIVA